MTNAQARDYCRRLFLETLDSLKISPHLRNLMSVRDGVLRVGSDSYSLSRFSSIRLIAFGKAAVEMAETAAGILNGASLRGIVVAPANSQNQRPSGGWDHRLAHVLELRYAGHPYPDEGSFQAARAILAMLDNCSPRDLILFLLSGGGSALVEKPLASLPIALEEMRRLHQVLVTCGANIQEINALRKHFSAVKGGRLAQRAAPAAQITVYVSDVPEELPSAVASGPTMPDESTIADCRRIVGRYGLDEKFPATIRAVLESGQLPETPKPGDTCFAQSRYYCLLSNQDGIEMVARLAGQRKIPVETDVSCDDWHFECAADYLLGRLDALRRQHRGEPVLLVSGGELSSPLARADAPGRGGRNQAFVLSCVPKIAGRSITVLSAGTDGIDGNSPAAGAVADGQSAGRAAALGLDAREFLRRQDSYSFFDRLGDAIMTGPTGTNVRDLRLLLAYG